MTEASGIHSSATDGTHDLSDARTAVAQLSANFEPFNEVHQHSSLKIRKPRAFRRRQAAVNAQALYCE
jgi:hypothetical protein